MKDPLPAAPDANDGTEKTLQKRRRAAHLIALAFLVGLIAVLAYEGVQTVRSDHSQPTAAQVALTYTQDLARSDYPAAWKLTAPAARGGETQSQWIDAMQAPGAHLPLAKSTLYRVDAASLQGAYVRVLVKAGQESQPSVAVDLEYAPNGWAVRDLVSPSQPAP